VLVGEAPSYQTGNALSAADINHDGIDDIVIGAPGAGDTPGAGETYVVFGKSSAWSSSMSLGALNGTNGFVLTGEATNDNSGWSVGAGDVNNDGIDDIVIGADGDAQGGKAYVVFGKSSGWSSPMSLGALNGTNGGFVIQGQSGDTLGFSVSVRLDVNRDGIGDIVIGAPELQAL